MRFVLATFAAGLLAGNSAADVIVTHTPGGQTSEGFFPGQSFTTPAGGPWNQIQFNFFDSDDSGSASLPRAAGNLFVFTQPFVGSPNQLSSAAPGFVGQSAGVVANVYQFAPAVILLPNTLYYAYSDSSDQFAVDVGSGYPSGVRYFSDDPGTAFTAGQDTNFLVQGVPFPPAQTAVPEPATLAVFGGLAVAGLVARRRKWTA